jgi:hypothetical protein
LIMTKTIVHWTEDMNIQSRHPLAQLYGILRIALRSCYWQNHFIEYPSKTACMNFYKVVISSRIDYCTRAYIEKPFYRTRVIDTSRLIMTKTFVHWTEDIIESRHRLAQLYGILGIALRSCYNWQNHFNEYSCYLQNHLYRHQRK